MLRRNSAWLSRRSCLGALRTSLPLHPNSIGLEMKRLEKSILVMAAAGFLAVSSFSCKGPDCCAEGTCEEAMASEHPEGSEHPDHPEGSDHPEG